MIEKISFDFKDGSVTFVDQSGKENSFKMDDCGELYPAIMKIAGIEVLDQGELDPSVFGDEKANSLASLI